MVCDRIFLSRNYFLKRVPQQDCFIISKVQGTPVHRAMSNIAQSPVAKGSARPGINCQLGIGYLDIVNYIIPSKKR